MEVQFIPISGLLAENIKKGIDPEFVAKLRGTFSNKKIQASLSRIGLKEGSKITLQSGKLVIRSARVEKNSNNEVEDLSAYNFLYGNWVYYTNIWKNRYVDDLY